jgi:hypothetical protein
MNPMNPMPRGGAAAGGSSAQAMPGGTSPLTAQALFTSRAAQAVAGDARLSNTPLMGKMTHPLWHWSPDVRSDIFQFDLLQRTCFDRRTTSLWHVEVPFTAKAKPAQKLRAVRIISISRPSDVVLRVQAPLVAEYVDERGERLAEILAQADTLWAFWSAITNLDAVRTPKTVELIANALGWASTITMAFKHALACPRPVDYSSALQPIIPTPAHGSIPSGHGAAAYLFVELVRELLQLDDDSPMLRDLRRQAFRIAENRTVAGLHFPVDHIAGRLLGETLAAYFIALNTPAPAKSAAFAGSTMGKGKAAAADRRMSDEENRALGAEDACSVDAVEVPQPAQPPIIKELWDAAKQELQLLGYVA